MTINDLVTEIDTRRAGNLSSAIRVFLLGEAGENQKSHRP
jgi:predicted DNA-binding ribbon-helix-helix protein